MHGFKLLERMKSINKKHAKGLCYPVDYAKKWIYDDPIALESIDSMRAKYPDIRFFTAA